MILRVGAVGLLFVLAASAAAEPRVLTEAGSIVLSSEQGVFARRNDSGGSRTVDLFDVVTPAELAAATLEQTGAIAAASNRTTLAINAAIQATTSTIAALRADMSAIVASGLSDREQLNAVMACNGRGLVYNQAAAGCQKAAGDLTIVQNHRQLAAATANETGIFWVNSSHNERVYFVPREGKLLEVRGQERNLTRVATPVFGRGQSGGFQTGSTSWDPDHMYESWLDATAHDGDREVRLGRPIDGLRVGDKCLVILLSARGDAVRAAGNYELVDVKAISSDAKGITFMNPLENDYPYSASEGHIIRFQKVPDFVYARFNGNIQPARWDGRFGGVFAVMARTDITIGTGGRITMNCAGYEGGGSRNRHGGSGEGPAGFSLDDQYGYVPTDYLGHMGGGGGGRACSWSQSGDWRGDAIAGGGGGGGHASAGSPSRSNTSNCNRFAGSRLPYLTDFSRCQWAQGGGELGTADMEEKMFFGGGGGPRGGEWNCNSPATGGRGGGIVMLFAATVTVNGRIYNKGCSGWHRNYCHDAGGSGGGAGGSVYIKANEVQFGGSSTIDARGGNGMGAGNWCNQNAAGGAGAVGRIRIDYNLWNGRRRAGNGLAVLTRTQPRAAHSGPVAV